VAALDQIDGWDVPSAAAGVVGPDGLVATLGLDDDVTGAGGPEGTTVRHLLAHASGLPPDGDRTPLGPPERKRIYSNVGFEVLGDHVASAAGMPFAEYARLALVEPLELTSTSTDGSPAHGYRSSVDDLAAVLTAVVSGRLLAPETVVAMTSIAYPELAGVLPGFGPQDPNPWGLGVEVRGAKDPHWTAPSGSPRTWGHFGRSGTFLWWDPEASVGLVVLTDREFGPWAATAWPVLATAVLGEHR
jgi:CubicO group peptidase (beta-lactamase class C family)